MDFGLVLPTMLPGACTEGIEAGAEAAERLGWSTVWVTDHLMVRRTEPEDEYARIFEALTTLAYVAGRHTSLRLGASAICLPLRNAVQTAKELASLDALSGGRLVVALGVGDADDVGEFENLGVAGRFHRRGAYVDEAIRLWRHLWSGSGEPFEGRFHAVRDFSFSPLPAQGARLPIWTGGRSPAAYHRAGSLADGFHSSRFGPAEIAACLPHIRAAAEAAGRPMPAISVRVRLRFDGPAAKPFALAGSPADMLADLRAFEGLGVGHVALVLNETSPEAVAAAAERFQRDVISAMI
ncbi:MAG TPA: TIGR03619 family F420-dependent LLM class oxidoreductase [Chloroflexota bacterium]